MFCLAGAGGAASGPHGDAGLQYGEQYGDEADTAALMQLAAAQHAQHPGAGAGAALDPFAAFASGPAAAASSAAAAAAAAALLLVQRRPRKQARPQAAV